MIKRLVRISLVIWIALMPLGVALAQEEAAAWGPESIAIPKAVLRKVGTGQRVELPVEVQVDYLGNGNYLASYTVRVPQRHLAPDNVDSRQDWDPTYAVLVTIEQYYWAYDVPGGRAVSVDKYRARWDRYDGTVSWRDANMWAACYGWDVHGNFCYKRESRWVGYPNSGQWYDQYPSWRGLYVITNESSYQAGRADITLFRGGSTWLLDVCISQGGGSFHQC
jgi:hypothetical protein